jgi:hypothetical protein
LPSALLVSREAVGGLGSDWEVSEVMVGEGGWGVGWLGGWVTG